MKLTDVPDDHGNRGPLLSAQRYRDPEIVDEKLRAGDFAVSVVPIGGYRVVVDGHHSLAAALRAGVRPRLRLCIERCPGEDEDEDEWFRHQRRMGGDDWHDPVTGRAVKDIDGVPMPPVKKKR